MRPDPMMAGPTGVTRSGDFDIEAVDRIGAVDPAEWDAAAVANRLPVFYSRAFLSAYEQHPLTKIEAFRYLLLRRRGEGGPPAAVVPAYLQPVPDPLGCLATTYPQACREPALLSHVWHCYDTQLGGPTTDSALAAAVISALRKLARELDAPWCGLVNVWQDGPAAAALAGAGLPTRYLVDRFVADLTGLTDLDQLLRRSATPRARRNLERYYRRAAEHGVTRTVAPIDEVDLAAVAALCRRSAGKHGSHEYYPAGQFERFLAALGPAAQVIEIRERSRLAAVGVGLLDADRLHCWAGGADYRVDGNFSPYYLMFADAIDLALRLGRPVFEGGRGNPEFKRRHGLTARPLVACLVRS